MNKFAIITGSSSGFGLYTVMELAKNGFTVLATMRNLENEFVFRKMTDNQQILNRIHSYQLDVSDPNSVAKFKYKIDSLERVDVLINNAGLAVGGFAEEVRLKDYQSQFDTNFFGVISVTQCVLQKMREQNEGSIINISSISGKIGFPGLSPYVSSKHALEGYTESLRLEVKPFGVNVALVEPGSFRTNIWNTSLEALDKNEVTDSAYREFKQGIMSRLEANKKKQGDPINVAKVIVMLAMKKKIRKLRYPVGRGVKLTIIIKHLIPWGWWEKIVHKSLKEN